MFGDIYTKLRGYYLIWHGNQNALMRGILEFKGTAVTSVTDDVTNQRTVVQIDSGVSNYIKPDTTSGGSLTIGRYDLDASGAVPGFIGFENDDGTSYSLTIDNGGGVTSSAYTIQVGGAGGASLGIQGLDLPTVALASAPAATFARLTYDGSSVGARDNGNVLIGLRATTLTAAAISVPSTATFAYSQTTAGAGVSPHDATFTAQSAHSGDAKDGAGFYFTVGDKGDTSHVTGGFTVDLHAANASGNSGAFEVTVGTTPIISPLLSVSVVAGDGVVAVKGSLSVTEWIALPPSTAPSAPASGWVVYTDAGDSNKLKAKASTGTVVTLGTP